jgi:DNA-binding MarR family transcriptional regulator
MQAHFGTTPPSIHQMIMTLEPRGLISRVAGQARSIRVLVAKEELPELE